MNASTLNNEGDSIEKESTVSRKRLSVQTELDVRRDNPVQNKFLRSARYFNRPTRKVYRKKRHKLKKKLKPCYICANLGHSGNFCPQVNTCSACSKKERKNNVEEDHTSMFCLKCGSTGHDMFSCTNDYDPEDIKGIQCYICMDFGHLCCAENSTEGPREASCYSCGQSGHHGFECTKMNTVANDLQPVSICLKCGKRVHSPQYGELDNKSTPAETTTLGNDAMLDKSVVEKSRKSAGEMDDKSSLTEATVAGIDVVPNSFVRGKSRTTQAWEKVNKSASAETSLVRKDAVPDKSINGKSRKTRRRKRKRKRKPVIPTSNAIHSLPTMPMLGYTIPRNGQYYGNPVSNVWLSPPAAVARNCLVNSPALNQSTYREPGLNVWLSPPAAAARNYLEIFPAVNQSHYQTGFHSFHYNTNYREVTHVPPNPFRPCSLLPHERFHQGSQIHGPPQNRVQLPHQSFAHQIRPHVPRSTFDSGMGISQPPELPHPVSNHRTSALLPQQKLQHQLSSHRTWMAPDWKPNS